jgi:hypothetical protein
MGKHEKCINLGGVKRMEICAIYQLRKINKIVIGNKL